MTIKFKLFFTVLLASFFVLSFNACDDDVSNPSENPPEMPPASTLKINFDEFPLSSSLLKNGQNFAPDNITTSANWGWASFNVVVWQTLVTAGMTIPVAAFVESFNHDAEKQEDGRWMWSYEFTPFTGIKHTASLFADVGTNSVGWEMYITKDGQYTDFLWYTGESDLLATAGTWTIYAEPANPTEWLEIEWNRDPSENTASVKYTNIIPNHAENGGYIFYGITSDNTYDAFYEIFNKGQDNLISIRWNKSSKAGSVMDGSHFGDAEWHCWDENLDDIDCP